MDSLFDNKTLLITGGTGSFGNAMVRAALVTNVGEIRIFSRDEKKQHDMRLHYKDPRLRFFIGSVRDPDALRMAMRGVDYVFHAAALKQVPSCEFFPLEAVKTNVFGCANVLEAAVANGVEKVVVLSTDKAVYAINAMGLTKAIAEKVMVAMSRDLNGSGTTLCATRYGNVLASRGSVVPTFIEQVRRGERLTVTDPRMTRFIMTLEEAVRLVEYAFRHAQNGELFVQRSPAARLSTIAQAVQELYGVSRPFKIIGMRHGEKRFETLVSREEMRHAELVDRYFRIRPDSRDLNYEKYFTEGDPEIAEVEEYTSDNAEQLGVEELKEILMTVPRIRADLLGEVADELYAP